MTEYRDAFEALSERGDTIGATALIERIEFEPVPAIPRSPVPPRRGVLVAAAVFVVVLVVGAALSWTSRKQSDVVDVPDIEWIQIERGLGATNLLTAGPGGFVRHAGHGEGLQFSSDGASWVPARVPKSTPGDFRSDFSGFELQASADIWILERHRFERDAYWTSTDGIEWTRNSWSETLGAVPSQLIASPGGFFAGTLGDRPLADLWWSTDGRDWRQIDGPSDQIDRATVGAFRTAAGLVALTYDTDEQPRMAITTDGSSWRESVLEFPGLAGTEGFWVRALDFINDRWVLVAGSSDASEPEPHVWTSPDAIEWTYRGVPSFASAPDGRVGFGLPISLGNLLVAAPLEYGEGVDDVGSTFEFWATADGITWQMILEDLPSIGSLAGRSNPDGTVTVVMELND